MSEDEDFLSDDDYGDDCEVSEDECVTGVEVAHASAEEKLKLSVLFGSMTDLPQEQKNVMRIFLSSTFTDMTIERNMLMSSVFPKLKEYCQQAYHLEFQVVDMRWGVQDQAVDDHSTTELCMREITNCQRESAGPTFVCFLGDRYGTRFLNKTITEEVWPVLLSHIQEAEVKELLQTWYKLDNNSAKPQRVLQPISSVENGVADWDRASVRMYECIRNAAITARDNGNMSAETAQQFIRSVTEEEIEGSGMLSDDADCKLTCLAFHRQINNINTQHVKARRFVDLLEDNKLDTEKQDLMKKLKGRVCEKMPAHHVKEYSIDWSDKDGINADDHKEYLQTFCDDFYVEVKRLIDSGVQSQDQGSKTVHDDLISREVLAHSKTAQDKLSKVVPRMDILDKIKSYITGDSDRPLVVHGHSGCGKTSVMASVAEQAPEWLKKADDEDKPVAVVLRFLGTSPVSSDIELLLANLNSQLQIILSGNGSGKPSSDKSLKDLISEFHRHIKSFEKSPKQLVIAIDSIDQLRRNDVAFNLAWLPEKLPRNVKFIISTLPDIYGILKSAQSMNLPVENFVEVKPLDEKSAWTIIDKWLEMSDRKLADEQRRVVSEAFKDRSLPPLYIKLVFDILIKWTSHRQVSSIPTDVAACMDQLFNNLENTHGEVQVKLALGYLTCCPGGISETELEDVLSIDDDFLTTVFQYHVPPVRRIPPTLWVRIKSDIRDYLVEKESNGVAAMSWYHRQFIEYATKRYVTGQKHTTSCMSTLNDYFTGKWSETPKPFTYTESQMKKLQITDKSASALRYVAAQPTRYSKLTFNARKISVLSQIWSGELMKDLAYQNSAGYLMDIEFLTGKFLHDSWRNIDTELSSLVSYMKEKNSTEELLSNYKQYEVEFGYIYAMLKMYSGLLSMGPCSVSAQIFACLQDKYNLSPPVQLSDAVLPNLSWFLQELTGGKGVDMCPLLSVTKTLESPGGMQVIARQHASLRKLFPFTYKGMSAVAALSDEMVIHIIEDSGVITEYATIPLSSSAPDYGRLLSLAEDENYLFCNSSGTFCIISLDNKRVELDVDEVEVEPGNEDIFCSSDVMEVFLNPFISGKDSIMFYSYESELALIYSVKLRKVVWYQHIPESSNDQKGDEIYYMSLHETDKAHMKTMMVVHTGKTEVYQVEILEDGDVKVTWTENLPNGFFDESGAVTVRKPSYSVHGDNQTDIVVPSPPNSGRLMISGKSGVERSGWTYYKLSRKCSFQLVGKLRSGLDILSITTNDTINKNMIELYTAKSRNNIGHSATFSCAQDPAFVYMVPHSDVLIVGAKNKIYVYFLTELEWPLIEVVQAYEFVVDNETPDDLLADPRGFLVTSSPDSSCRFWDLTAVSERDVQKTNPRHRTEQTCMQISCPPTLNTLNLILQDHGNVWDASSNEYLGTLPGNDDDDQPMTSNWYPGDDKHQFYVSIIYTELLCVVGVNFSLSANKQTMQSELIHKHSLVSVSEACPHNKGVIAISDDTGVLYDFKIDQMTKDMGKGLRLLTEDGTGKPCRWQSVGFTALEYCYADTVFLVSGDDCDPKDDDADPEECVLVYDTTTFKLINKIVKSSFSYAVYFQNFDLVICTHSDPGLRVFDTKTLESKDVQLEKEPDSLSMLESYGRTEGMYNTEEEPYFYCYSGKNGLLKMDVTKYEQWPTGEGITYLGKYNTHYGDCRLSNGRGYIAGIMRGLSAIELSKLKDDSLELLGEFKFQGDVDSFSFSADDNYITAVLSSGEVICLKILDPTEPSLATEVSKLSCTRNRVCVTQEELVKDSRWTSMSAVTGTTGRPRTVDTLYEFIKNYVKPRDRPEESKAAYPLVGTEKFNQLYSGAVDNHTNEYTPTLQTRPLDLEELLKERKLAQSDVKKYEQPPLKPHPPATPKSVQPPPPGLPTPGAPQGSPPLLPPQEPPPGSPPVRPPGLSPSTGQVIFPPPPQPPSLPPVTPHPPPPNLKLRVREPKRRIEPEVPKNLKLYHDLPSDEKSKKLESAISDVNTKRTVLCSIL